MLKVTAILLAFALTVTAALARDTAHSKPPKVAHNQAKAQKKAMNQSAKTQRKDLKKTRKRSNP